MVGWIERACSRGGRERDGKTTRTENGIEDGEDRESGDGKTERMEMEDREWRWKTENGDGKTT
jgi:hypothetical protein